MFNTSLAPYEHRATPKEGAGRRTPRFGGERRDRSRRHRKAARRAGRAPPRARWARNGPSARASTPSRFGWTDA